MLRDVRRAKRARERLWSSRCRHSCSRPPRARHCASPRITDILRRRTRSPTPLCVGVAFAVRLRTPLTATTVRPTQPPAVTAAAARLGELSGVQRGYWGARTSLTSSIPRSTLLRLVYVSREVHLVFSSLPRRVRPIHRVRQPWLAASANNHPVVVLLAPLWGSTVISTFRERCVR